MQDWIHGQKFLCKIEKNFFGMHQSFQFQF